MEIVVRSRPDGFVCDYAPHQRARSSIVARDDGMFDVRYEYRSDEPIFCPHGTHYNGERYVPLGVPKSEALLQARQVLERNVSGLFAGDVEFDYQSS